MPLIIKNAEVVDDHWQLLDEDAEALPQGQVLVPLVFWNEHQQDVAERPDDIGVWLASNELPEDIANLDSVPVVAVRFDNFMDGRGFSIARLLRERFGYQGEIRAIGNPIRDQLTYMARCGFNAFDLAEHYDAAEALESLKDFSENYQISVEQKTPLFRRRA